MRVLEVVGIVLSGSSLTCIGIYVLRKCGILNIENMSCSFRGANVDEEFDVERGDTLNGGEGDLMSEDLMSGSISVVAGQLHRSLRGIENAIEESTERLHRDIRDVKRQVDTNHEAAVHLSQSVALNQEKTVLAIEQNLISLQDLLSSTLSSHELDRSRRGKDLMSQLGQTQHDIKQWKLEMNEAIQQNTVHLIEMRTSGQPRGTPRGTPI